MEGRMGWKRKGDTNDVLLNQTLGNWLDVETKEERGMRMPSFFSLSVVNELASPDKPIMITLKSEVKKKNTVFLN